MIKWFFRSDFRPGSNTEAIARIAKQCGDNVTYYEGKDGLLPPDAHFDIAVTNNPRNLKREGRRLGDLTVNTHHGIAFEGSASPDPHIDVTLAQSKFHAALFLKNGYKPEQILHIGRLPRLDLIADYPFNKGRNNTILYAPTWDRQAFCNGTKYFWSFSETLEDDIRNTRVFGHLLEATNYQLIVRLHTNQMKAWGGKMPSYITDVLPASTIYESMITNPDSYSTLVKSDIIITDFSSIAFDYLVLDRPIIFTKENSKWCYTYNWGFPKKMREDFGILCPSMASLTCNIVFAMEYPAIRSKERKHMLYQYVDYTYGGSIDAYNKIVEAWKCRKMQ